MEVLHYIALNAVTWSTFLPGTATNVNDSKLASFSGFIPAILLHNIMWLKSWEEPGNEASWSTFRSTVQCLINRWKVHEDCHLQGFQRGRYWSQWVGMGVWKNGRHKECVVREWEGERMIYKSEQGYIITCVSCISAWLCWWAHCWEHRSTHDSYHFTQKTTTKK